MAYAHQIGWRMAPLLGGLLLVLAAAPALGQETYRLENGDWKQQTPPDPNSPEGQLQHIRKLIAEDKASEAWDLADEWIEKYPNHYLLPEAYLLRGDAKAAYGSYYKALYDYEYLLKTYPSSERFFTALDREYEIAKLFAAGMPRKIFGIRLLEATGEAEELFVRIQERAPGSAVGEKASMALGDYYFDHAEMSSAAEAYELFLENYPQSAQRERAELQLIRASLATFKGPRYDATGLIDAQQYLKTFQREFPASAERLGVDAMRVRIDESLALKTLKNADWYRQRGERVSAVYMYQRVIQDHPQTAAAREALARVRQLDPSILPEGEGAESPARTPATVPAIAPTTAPTTAPAKGAGEGTP